MKRVLLAPAAGPGVGGGHVMRCLTLAETLVARGVICTFVVDDEGAALMERFGAGFAVRRQAIAMALDAEAFDALVIDDYGVGAEQELGFRRKAQTLIVIDDLANRQHRADLLIDPGYGRDAAHYDGLLPDPTLLLTGPFYALVKSAFNSQRPAALARPIFPSPKRIFLSFGLSDVDGITGRAAAAVRARYPDVVIDIALGRDAQSLPTLLAKADADPALHLHLDAMNIPELMAGADAAIGAGGASTWERASLGLPTLAVIVADNQRPMIQALAADGALLTADLHDPAFEAVFDGALARLWDPAERTVLKATSAALCDGQGAARIADAVLSLLGL